MSITAPGTETFGDPAVKFTGVTKAYALHKSPFSAVLDAFGLLPQRCQPPVHVALKGIDLQIDRGMRLGIIGRNGSGKSTLLKLINGNFATTSGKVELNGTVHALLEPGGGFHPELSGWQNAATTLTYSGLQADEIEEALQALAAFAELGEFLHQPIATYSAGMLSRLAFAAATAIRPDILVIDEVMGAGDAYFQTKSAERMRSLTGHGVTLILVSHSMQQVMEFCDQAIWLDQGEIRARGDVETVVRAYSEHIARLEQDFLDSLTAQTPATSPTGSLSSTDKLRIANAAILNGANERRHVVSSHDRLRVELVVESASDGEFQCRFVMAVRSLTGRLLSVNLSPPAAFQLPSGGSCRAELIFDDFLFGNGVYEAILGIVPAETGLPMSVDQVEQACSAVVQLTVIAALKDDPTIFYHPARWLNESDPEGKVNASLP